jgi:hypothetical protein
MLDAARVIRWLFGRQPVHQFLKNRAYRIVRFDINLQV